MRITRTLCVAGLLCGLFLGAMAVSGGCSGPPAEVTENEQTKKVAEDRGEKMKNFRKGMGETASKTATDSMANKRAMYKKSQ
jgi:hypothetical protein